MVTDWRFLPSSLVNLCVCVCAHVQCFNLHVFSVDFEYFSCFFVPFLQVYSLSFTVVCVIHVSNRSIVCGLSNVTFFKLVDYYYYTNCHCLLLFTSLQFHSFIINFVTDTELFHWTANIITYLWNGCVQAVEHVSANCDRVSMSVSWSSLFRGGLRYTWNMCCCSLL